MDSVIIVNSKNGMIALWGMEKIREEIDLFDYQTLGGISAKRIASNSKGNFVILYSRGGGPELGGFCAQIFDDNIDPLGSDIRISWSGNTEADVCLTLEDNVITTWIIPLIEKAIYVCGFDKVGSPVMDTLRVDDDTTFADKGVVDIACSEEGEFIIVWMDGRNSDRWHIYGQRFGSDGIPIGNNFKVNDTWYVYARYPGVATDKNGNCVVVWQEYDNIQAQLYDSTGAKIGPNFQVNDVSPRGYSPRVSMNREGRFIVAWFDLGNGIFVRLFAKDGSPMGEDIRVNDFDSGLQIYPDVAIDNNGSFMVIWEDDRFGGPAAPYPDERYYTDIFGQYYGKDGIPKEANFMVNDATYPFQSGQGIAFLKDECFVVLRNDCDYWGSSCVVSMSIWSYAQRQSGSFHSEVFDAGESKNWWTVFWTGTEPESTSLGVKLRASDSAFSPLDILPNWITVSKGQSGDLPCGRFLQYCVDLQSESDTESPALYDITISSDLPGQVSGEWSSFTTADGLIDNKVYCIATDFSGNLWFGTYGGASSFDGTNWTSFTSVDGLANDVVWSIAVDLTNTLWFGTFEGVSRYDGSSWTNFTTVNGLINNSVGCMAVDLSNNIWFGTTEGVSRYDGVTWTNFTTAEGLVDNRVYAIEVDSYGDIWFGTSGGVSKYDGASWTCYTTADGLTHDVISDIFIDPSGDIWFATAGGGVSKYDGVFWTTLSVETGLCHNHVSSIARTAIDNMWFGTWHGVSRYNGQYWITYTWLDGLAHNEINDAHTDLSGDVWFATKDGASRYREEIETSLVKGDLNSDSVVNVLDLVLTVNIILGKLEPSSEQQWVADMNDDASINILDVVSIINEILSPK